LVYLTVFFLFRCRNSPPKGELTEVRPQQPELSAAPLSPIHESASESATSTSPPRLLVNGLKIKNQNHYCDDNETSNQTLELQDLEALSADEKTSSNSNTKPQSKLITINVLFFHFSSFQFFYLCGNPSHFNFISKSGFGSRDVPISFRLVSCMIFVL
jgi:hypothetical protein